MLAVLFSSTVLGIAIGTLSIESIVLGPRRNMFPKSQYLQVPGGGNNNGVCHRPATLNYPSVGAPSRHSSLPAPIDGSSPLLAINSLPLETSHSLGNFASLHNNHLLVDNLNGGARNGPCFPLEIANRKFTDRPFDCSSMDLSSVSASQATRRSDPLRSPNL